jgi:hypothetical protein
MRIDNLKEAVIIGRAEINLITLMLQASDFPMSVDWSLLSKPEIVCC